MVCHLQFQCNLWWYAFLEVRDRDVLIGLRGVVVFVCQIFHHLLCDNCSGVPAVLGFPETSGMGDVPFLYRTSI